MDNMQIYEQARKVPEEAKKTIGAGRLKGMTDINPMWRIKRLTEMFGPCGVGWWYTIDDKRIVDDALTNQRAAFVDITLFYVDSESGAESHGVPGTGGASFVAQERNGAYLSDECFKMALTDAISVAAKALGIGADVYFAADRSKYSSIPAAQAEIPKLTCDECSKVIFGYKGKNGKDVTPEQHIAITQATFKQTLCVDCAKKAQAAMVKTDGNASN